MIKINNKNISSVYYGEKVIGKIYKGLVKVYESWRDLLVSGIPPLTLTKSKGVDLVDYKIYGNSVQGENMVTYPYLSPNGFVSNGITFTINSDKSITANGTATADTYFQINSITFEANKTYIIHKAPKGASSTTYSLLLNGVKRVVENDEYVTLTEEKTGVFYVLIHKGNTVNNLTFYPRIVEAPTPDTPIEVESVGERTKNLLNLYDVSSYPITKNGITFNVDKTTGRIYISGTASTGTTITLFPELFLNSSKTYTVSLLGKGTYSGLYTCAGYDENSNTIWDYSIGAGTTKIIRITNKNKISKIDIWFNANTTCEEGLYVEFQVEEGETATAYEPYGYRIPVKIRGKNLLDLSEIHGKSYTSNGATMSIGEDGGISVSGTPTGYIGTNVNDKPNLQGITTFSMLGEFANLSWQVILRDESNNNLLDFTVSKAYPSKTINIDDYPTYNNIVHYIKRSANNVQMGGTAYLQIEEGNGTKDYEPFKGEKTTYIYLKEPLRKIGDYADYIDFDNKKVVRNIKEYTLTGTEVVQSYNTIIADKYRLFVVVPDARGADSNTIGVMSSHYLGQTASYLYMCNRGISCHGNPSFVIIYDENYQTPASLKAFLKEQYDNGTPVKAIYLREPTEETIELPNIPTLKGTTTLEVDTTIQPSNMEVIYKGKA